jgi:hypothetical protein
VQLHQGNLQYHPVAELRLLASLHPRPNVELHHLANLHHPNELLHLVEVLHLHAVKLHLHVVRLHLNVVKLHLNVVRLRLLDLLRVVVVVVVAHSPSIRKCSICIFRCPLSARKCEVTVSVMLIFVPSKAVVAVEEVQHPYDLDLERRWVVVSWHPFKRVRS